MNDVSILKSYFLGYLLENPFDLIGFISCFIPIISVAINYKSLKNHSRELIYYSILIFLHTIIASFYAAFSKNNHSIYLIFYLFESIFLIIYYTKEFKKESLSKFFIAVLIFICGAIIFNLFTNNLINNYSITIQSIGFIIISLISFYLILSRVIIGSLTHSMLFWINTGVLIYFSGIFFVFLFLNEFYD